ncbi:hypothetical protein AB0H18_18040 [Streptomyces sp. NPDC020766]|uniref:hypothetical protein n=1 Tax=Streptomyces sp. NPDC020766 TaxID=3155011 RepID=UPI0033E6D08C
MSAVRWDQRAVAQVTVRGTATDQELFTSALSEQGWVELDSSVPTGLTPLTEGRAEYLVEARFPGSSYRAVTGARQRLEVLGERLRLELTVRAVDLIRREPDPRPRWTAFRPAASQVRAATAGRFGRLRLAVAEARGTGRQTRADTEAEALSLSHSPLPGTAPPPADIQVRPSWAETGFAGPVAAASRPHLLKGLRYCLIILLAIGVAGTQSAETSPAQPRFWIFGVTGLGALAATALVLRHNRPDWPRRVRALALVCACGGSLFFGMLTGEALTAFAPDGFSGGYALLILLAALTTARCLALLLRHASLRAVLPWLLPALLPFLPGLFPSVGLWQPTLYLNELGVDVEDVEVSAWDQFQSVLAVLAAISLWLVAPALLGLAHHLHFMVRERWIGYAGFVLLSVWGMAIGAWQFAYLPAVDAGVAASHAVSEGDTAPPGYGVEPEWVCVIPVDTLKKTPVDGGILDPKEPYLEVGDADGTAVLISSEHSLDPIRVPLSSVHLVALGTAPGSHACTPEGTLAMW